MNTDIDTVICTSCEEDYSESDIRGGGMIGDKPVCPLCLRAAFDIVARTDPAWNLADEEMVFAEFVIDERLKKLRTDERG